MTSLSLATLLLLCVSVHACTALSPPSLTKKETPHKVGFPIQIASIPFLYATILTLNLLYIALVLRKAQNCILRPIGKHLKLLIYTIHTKIYNYIQGLDKIKLLETLTVSSVMDYKQEENQPQQQKVANNEIIIEETSGTSFQMDSPSFLAAQDERRHARSMLGPAQLNHEETVVTNTEDIVQMDYAQPHRRPPIHNQKP
ncbi:hypothetical protein VNO78_07870 [Psophocarpus tetragonolobus]|uniref:Uncharacterized protein n=1 Tax=Psophocarpus tetragonolobus TaxID=3891 RepID=A0AAN9SVD4_PSOTE